MANSLFENLSYSFEYSIRDNAARRNDPKARKVMQAAADRFTKIERLCADLRIMIYTERAREELAQMGYEMDTSEWRHAFLEGDKDAAESILASIYAKRNTELHEAVTPEIRRLHKIQLEELTPLIAPLRAAEEKAISHLTVSGAIPQMSPHVARIVEQIAAAMEEPVDMSLHFDKHMALSGWFPADQPLVPPKS